jgi:hypothetical protein
MLTVFHNLKSGRFYEMRYVHEVWITVKKFPAVLTVGLLNDAVSAAQFSFKALSFHSHGENEEGFENSQLS